jgi:mannose-1-phosphate guanylyltransferase
VRDEEKLRSSIAEAVTAAVSDDVLVTLGIPSSHPHTGYGYIKRGPHLAGRVHRVERFFEKPSLERARKYLEEGSYSWNSGMFIWRSSVILDAFREFLPEMYQGLIEIKGILEAGFTARGQERIDQIFAAFESISIDFGILEHTRNCLVVNADEFGWNDVGSWDQWAENFATDSNHNLVKGDAVVIDSQQCVVKSDGRLLALVGMKDVVVIDTGDAVLVCARDSVQDVKKVVDELKRRGRVDLV